MKSFRKKTIGAVLSTIFPGAGHLYMERYIFGTAGVILFTWAIIGLLVSTVIFTPSAGIGSAIFPFSLYLAAAVWTFMLSSIILSGFKFRRRTFSRKEVYAEAYGLYLEKKYEEAVTAFGRLFDYSPDDFSAGIMLARSNLFSSQPRKALTLARKLLKRAKNATWKWEVETLVRECEDKYGQD